MKRIAAAAVVYLAFVQPGWAGFDEGFAAAQRGDYATALREWKPLAEDGSARAQVMLGALYDNGHGVSQDRAEAARWYRKAADQGLAVAQFNLGVAYRDGQGVPQDYGEAARWFLKAANKGNPKAQFILGSMYSEGQGVPQDYVESHKWFNLAAARFLASDKEARNYAVQNRDNLASKMTPAQIAEAQKLAREWMAAFEKRGGK